LPAGRQRVPVGDEVGEVFGSLLVVRVPCGLELRLALGGDGAARGCRRLLGGFIRRRVGECESLNLRLGEARAGLGANPGVSGMPRATPAGVPVLITSPG
jgi:hypothetical protein